MMLIFKSAKKLPFPVVRHFQVDPLFFFDKKLPQSKVELEERQIQFASRQKWQPLTIGEKPYKNDFLFFIFCWIVVSFLLQFHSLDEQQTLLKEFLAFLSWDFLSW